MDIDLFYVNKIGFKTTETKGSLVYEFSSYKSKPELGSRLIIGENGGIDLTGLEVINTIEELERHYFESTETHLKNI